ncbi:hypothetical protein LCGC14_1423090 [marine sediment metagenome]|uniref:Uncharacterized protein n=1 Tax=marine sediment metagenome TaxID=412755 RepID=A0A0F9J0C4_9ZZZZ
MKTLREKFAELAHSQWSGWMKYLFSKGEFNKNGTWTMPKWAVERWTRQMNTPYLELSESEKDNDREESDKFLKIIEDSKPQHPLFHRPRYDYLNRPE